jgi:prepilin-type processing-associated H-X9-DG protein
LRNILIATNLAKNDNNGEYPVMRGFSWEPPDDGSGVWIWDALSPYLGYSAGGNPATVLRCPDALINPAEGWLQAPGYCSYRYNVYCAQNHVPTTGNAAMLFFDATWNTWVPPQCAHSPGNGAHINVGYADGSVSSMPFAMFLNLDSGNEATSDFFNLGWTR